jgi:SAM-dependent methyltransferase
MNKEKQMILSAIDTKSKSIVDLGCGTGEFSEIFSPKNYYGVDIDSPGIEHAKILHPKYKFSAINSVSDLRGKYEVVALIDTAHHLNPDILRSTLSAIRTRLLAANGTLLIVDPVHPTEQKQLLGKWMFANDRGNFQRTKKEITKEILPIFKTKKYTVFQENILTLYLLLAKPIRKKRQTASA